MGGEELRIELVRRGEPERRRFCPRMDLFLPIACMRSLPWLIEATNPPISVVFPSSDRPTRGSSVHAFSAYNFDIRLLWRRLRHDLSFLSHFTTSKTFLHTNLNRTLP